MKRPKPQPDAPRFAHGDFVRRRVAKRKVGQVTAIVFLPGVVGYRVQFPDILEEFLEMELEPAEEPGEWETSSQQGEAGEEGEE